MILGCLKYYKSFIYVDKSFVWVDNMKVRMNKNGGTRSCKNAEKPGCDMSDPSIDPLPSIDRPPQNS